jgi:hypothetical protein
LPIPNWIGLSHYVGPQFAVMEREIRQTVALARGRPVVGTQRLDPQGTWHADAAGVKASGLAMLRGGAKHLAMWTSEQGVRADVIAAFPTITAAWRAVA